MEFNRELLDSELVRLTARCSEWELRLCENSELPDVAKEQIRSAVDQAQLLIRSKFQELADVIEKCSYVTTVITPADLQSFWDMVSLQVSSVNMLFEKLEKLWDGKWAISEPSSMPAAPVGNGRSPSPASQAISERSPYPASSACPVAGLSSLSLGVSTAAYCDSLSFQRDKISAVCGSWQEYLGAETNISVSAQEEIMRALGQARLLMTSKMQTFAHLLELYTKDATRQIRDVDIESFWDLVLVEVRNVDKVFENLNLQRACNWAVVEKIVRRNPRPAALSVISAGPSGLRTMRTERQPPCPCPRTPSDTTGINKCLLSIDARKVASSITRASKIFKEMMDNSKGTSSSPLQLFDKGVELSVGVQTDLFLDRPASPVYVPAKTGADAATQIYPGDLFDKGVELSVGVQTDLFLDRPASLVYVPAKTGADAATQIYPGDLFDKGVELSVGVQTDLFLDRPASPVYVPAKTGADAATQIYPGDLFDKGVELSVGVQTDLFLDRPASPVYVPAKTGADAATQIYPGDLFDKGVELSVGVQTDLFLDRPASPVYVPAKTGADAATQIYPGDLFDKGVELSVGVKTDLFLDRPASPVYVPAKTGADAATQIYPGDGPSCPPEVDLRGATPPAASGEQVGVRKQLFKDEQEKTKTPAKPKTTRRRNEILVPEYIDPTVSPRAARAFRRGGTPKPDAK